MRIFVTRASESPASTVVQYSTTANSSANNKNLIPGEESAPSENINIKIPVCSGYIMYSTVQYSSD